MAEKKDKGKPSNTTGEAIDKPIGRPVMRHPSRNLTARARGFGIGGGYERPLRKEKTVSADAGGEMYGPLPPAGYYGTGTAARPFERGQAGYTDELAWYRSQYGENTSGYDQKKKKK
jgi:hypothetical protein